MPRVVLALTVIVCASTAPALSQDYSLDRFQGPARIVGGLSWGNFLPTYRPRPLQPLPEVRISPPPAIEPLSEDPEPEGDVQLGPRAFCVRLCDGFFFPIGPAAYGGTERAQRLACSNLCPAAPSALYTLPQGGEVADAIGPRGERYGSLPVAFRYRERLTPGCTCSAEGVGLSRLPPSHDFTLRAGDLIVTEAGVSTITGSGSFPFSSRQFVAVDPHKLRGEIAQRILATRREGAPPMQREMQARMQVTNETDLKPPERSASRTVRVVPLFVDANGNPL